MTPNQLRQQADSLIKRGMFRRAANVLQKIIIHPEATEAERDKAQNAAARLITAHNPKSIDAARAAEAERVRQYRAARKEAEAAKRGTAGDGMRAYQQKIRQQWKEQQWTA